MSWKRLLAAVSLLIAVILALGFFWPFGRSEQVLHLPGVVEIQEVHLGSKVGGRVETVDIVEGATAEKDKVLVIFAAPELQAQRQQQYARVLAAEADLEKARNGPRPEEKWSAWEAVEVAEAHWELLRAGSRPEEIREAQSQYESAVADLTLAKQEYKRAERLRNENSMSQADYDIARAARDRSQNQAARAKAHLELLLAGSRKEDIAQATAELEKAMANLALLLAGTRREDIAAAEARLLEAQGKLNEIDANLQETVVKAPERVVVDVVAVRKGDLVTPNQPILRVLRAADLWVRIYVPETDLGKLQLNQEVTVTIDAYPGETWTGKVNQISTESEFTPRNVQSADERRHQVFGVKVKVEDPHGVFKSGMAAQVTVPLR
jgi:multidrug resistance efflux pump